MQHHDGRRRIGPRSDHAVFEPQRSRSRKPVVGERHALASRCVQQGRHDPQQLGKALLQRIARGVDLGLGAGIVGAARFEDRHEVRHGRAVLRHRAEIALRHHPAHVIFRPRLDPDGVAAAKQQRIGLRVGDDAAGGGDDRGVVRGDDALERAALVAAERGGAGHLDQVGNAGAVILLDERGRAR